MKEEVAVETYLPRSTVVPASPQTIRLTLQLLTRKKKKQYLFIVLRSTS